MVLPHRLERESSTEGGGNYLFKVLFSMEKLVAFRNIFLIKLLEEDLNSQLCTVRNCLEFIFFAS